MGLRLIKEEDSITLAISTSKVEANVETVTTSTIKLDEEDIMDLIADLTIWLEVKTLIENNDEERINHIIDMNTKAMNDAYEQSQSKLNLEKRLKDAFVDIFDSEYIEQQAAEAEIKKIIKSINKK
jgi:hypothetical protein